MYLLTSNVPSTFHFYMTISAVKSGVDMKMAIRCFSTFDLILDYFLQAVGVTALFCWDDGGGFGGAAELDAICAFSFEFWSCFSSSGGGTFTGFDMSSTVVFYWLLV